VEMRTTCIALCMYNIHATSVRNEEVIETALFRWYQK